MSHGGDPAQTVDICVVWGPNITTGGYRKVTYDHGDYTCYYSWSTEYDPAFSGNFLSNNHLIPTTPALRSLVRSIEVGDQIRLDGTLVDYTIKDGSGAILYNKRSTSLVRTDTGCEIIYLTGGAILHKYMPWRMPLLVFLSIIMVASFIGGFVKGIPPAPQEIIPYELLAPADPRDPTNPKNYIHNRTENTSNTPPSA
jgi:hypothetical protein